MQLTPNTSIRSRAFALATAAVIGLSSASAWGQTVLVANPPVAAKPQGVTKADCDIFFHHIAEEARDFSGKLSKTFLSTALRFKRAGCAAVDKDGVVQIITETEQDQASLGTALRLMGKVDIVGLSGVSGCHRPTNGVCPVRTGSNPPRVGG